MQSKCFILKIFYLFIKIFLSVFFTTQQCSRSPPGSVFRNQLWQGPEDYIRCWRFVQGNALSAVPLYSQILNMLRLSF